MIWRSDWLPDTVRLVRAGQAEATSLRFTPNLWRALQVRTADGWHFLVGSADAPHRLWWPARRLPPVGMALACLIELDGHAAERAAAALRYWRSMHDTRAPRPPFSERPPLMRRLLALRALDGRLAGASYRVIATALFGAVAAAEPWKTGSLRGRVIRLAGCGTRLMTGGYRDLLKPRKRRPRG